MEFFREVRHNRKTTGKTEWISWGFALEEMITTVFAIPGVIIALSIESKEKSLCSL
jgi:hypothetical protein